MGNIVLMGIWPGL